MQAQCPSCETVFRLTELEASTAAGMVQCGICSHFFNVSASNEPNQQSIISASNVHASAESDPLSEKSRGLAAQVLDQSLRENYVHPKAPVPWWSTMLWSILILLGLVAGLAQLAWYHHQELVQRPELEPYVLQACEHLPCSLTPEADLENIELLSRDVRSHPSKSKALLITATFINHAEFAQPYPHVGVYLSNLSGDVIAYRTMEPAEYLAEDFLEGELMSRDVPVTLIMEVEDPGQETVSYRFEFL